MLAALTVALATIVARLPFLLRGDRFFSSDEAVEGLMARHVLLGEFPLFLWGQSYKGVPEVYLASAVFGLAPATASSVVALKAVTLVCFAAFVGLNFILLDRVYSRTVAWVASLLLIACPPALVLWSLTGSAEIAITFLTGAVLLLNVDAWRRTGSRRALVVASASLGFGLWVQQFIVYYVIALALTLLVDTPDWRERFGAVLRARPLWVQRLAQVLFAGAAVYAAIGLTAFVTNGAELAPFGLRVTATSPQKAWWTAIALLLVGCAAAVGRVRRADAMPALAFLAGFSPAILGRLTGDGAGAPMGRMDLDGLRSILSVVVDYAVPVVFGFRSPTMGRLDVSAWWAAVLAIVLVVSCGAIRRGRRPLFFHVFLVVVPVAFVASGSFIDAQSYRYLVPVFAALPVVWAVGVEAILRVSRIAGTAVLAGLVALFAIQQVEWYQELAPDRESAAIVDCLDRAGIRIAFADYWVSYKVTFLTGERIVLAPTNGVDRYPPYTDTARAHPAAHLVEAPPPESAEQVSCSAVVREVPADEVPRPPR